MNRLSLYLMFLIAGTLPFLFSCSKEESTDKIPTITFLQGDTTLIGEGAIVGEGMPMKFGISMLGGGTEVTNLVIEVRSPEDTITMLDYGMYKEKLDTVLTFYKGSFEDESWFFRIMNKDRITAFISMNIQKDSISHYGEILFLPSVTMGFQENNDFGHYLNLNDGIVLSTQEATADQENVDLLVYYYLDGTTPSPTFSSPGDQDAPSFYPEINSWELKNYTKYDYVTKVSEAEFDAANNDSLLVKSYNEFWGRRKYKYAVAGIIFPFKTISGKIGLVKVLNSDMLAGGKITFSIKVQN